MRRRRILMDAAFAVLVFALATASAGRSQQAPSLDVTIDTNSARGTLQAMQNPTLTHEEALRVAKLEGSQGALRKLHEFHVPSTTEDFANALYKTAHHEAIASRTEKSMFFDLVRPKTTQLLQLLDEMQANPESFQGAIKQRIAMFTPPDAALHLRGFVLAGGDGGGYAFGSTDFYLNIGFIDDLVLARSVTTHEMYHAVQGAFAKDRELTFTGPDNPRREACRQVERLFANLYEEGTAVLVADPSLIPKSHSAAAARILADDEEGRKHLGNSATLLEMTVIALQAEKPPPYDDMYSVGFLGHGVLYSIAYTMAQGIDDADGADGVTTLLKQPPYRFVLRYADLPLYGKDAQHPTLGVNTLAAARSLASGCN